MLPAWAAPYIGIPHVMGGRSKEGCDCYGLYWIVLAEVFGVTPPAYEGIVWDRNDSNLSRAHTGAVIEQAAEQHFREVERGQERPGDAVVLRIAGHPLHIGMVCSPGWMLHSAEPADSAGERYDGLVWGRRVMGFHRARGMK